MQTRWEPKYPVFRDFLRRHHDEGRVEGEARGRIEGRVEALLTLLSARKLAVTDAARDRIRGTTDCALLDRWLVRAISVDTIDALFDDC